MKVTILTNSLASQDVPAVNSHYKRWRKPLLKAGVELYEVAPRRRNSARRSRTHRPRKRISSACT